MADSDVSLVSIGKGKFINIATKKRFFFRKCCGQRMKKIEWVYYGPKSAAAPRCPMAYCPECGNFETVMPWYVMMSCIGGAPIPGDSPIGQYIDKRIREKVAEKEIPTLSNEELREMRNEVLMAPFRK